MGLGGVLCYLNKPKETNLSMPTVKETVVQVVDALKGEDIQVLEVKTLTLITDHMIIATGNSIRHIQAMAKQLVQQAKAKDIPVLGVEGERTGEWVLIDLGETIVHLMTQGLRQFYRLEKLWASPGEPALAV